MSYIPLVESPRGAVRRAAFRYGRRMFGRDVEPVRAAAHHAGVLIAMAAVETAADKGWHALDEDLRWLAVQCAATTIGCSWCTDFGWYLGHQQGVDAAKVTGVPHWRDSEVYEETERLVLDYAETASVTPAAVDADVVSRLTERIGAKAMVELAGWVALEHFRSRFNAGLGLRSQGFADSCPAPVRVAG